MKASEWLISWLTIVIVLLTVVGCFVYKVDPFFHYHRPDLGKYYYTLDNQRSQNNGIIIHFDYDLMVTGTSMTENFRSSEVDKLFGSNSIKVPFGGGYYKEINDNIEYGLKVNRNLNTVIRCLDMTLFLVNWDDQRTDMGEFPTYLYDSNPLNDVEYLLNRDIFFDRVYAMIIERKTEGFSPGITSFDDYSRWQDNFKFGIQTVKPGGLYYYYNKHAHLTEEEKEIIKKNIAYNVLRTADANPDVQFYYFFPPYSISFWSDNNNAGKNIRILEAEELIINLILPHKNIHLFSFNNRIDITADLNNYKDNIHYGAWINSLILKWMHDGKYQITLDNYKEYIQREYELYASFDETTYDYASINNQLDYEADYYAAALLNEELTGVKPIDILSDSTVMLNGIEYVADDSSITIKGVSGLHNTINDLPNCVKNSNIGASFEIDLDEGYNYLCLNGKKLCDDGILYIYVYNDEGYVVREVEVNVLDNCNHQYVVDLSKENGNVKVVIVGYCDGGADSSVFELNSIMMY